MIRTVWFKEDSPVIYHEHCEYRPVPEPDTARDFSTAFKTGDKVLVAPTSDGKLAVKHPSRSGMAPTEMWELK